MVAAPEYHFNPKKITGAGPVRRITVTTGQLTYELVHLKRKLRTRSPSVYRRLRGLPMPEPHAPFRRVDGAIEAWEKVR